MSSKKAPIHTVSTTQPPAAQSGDEWFNPNNNTLFKYLLTSGTTPGWSFIGTYPLSIYSRPPTIDLVLVGGGGGGAGQYDAGGGGGAGGVITVSTVSLTPGYTIVVVVGAGGAGGLVATPAGTRGIDSTIVVGTAGYRAYGGGPGGINANAAVSSNGGSGGGSGAAGTAVGTQLPGIAVFPGSTYISDFTRQGYNGGYPIANDTNGAAGGGGGAGAVGANAGATTGSGGNGGIGIINPFTDSNVGQLVTTAYYIGGGGGGGTRQNPAGVGGSGGGGRGGNITAGAFQQGVSGTTNTGGGGGGGGVFVNNTSGNGASGGSGVVIMRHSDAYGQIAMNTGSANTVSFASNGYRYYQFFSSATFLS